MIDLPADLSPELVPLSWLLGTWEGTGVVSFPRADGVVEFEFGQRMVFEQEGLPYLRYQSFSWRLDGDEQVPFTSETGIWRLARLPHPGDHGPGMLPGEGEPFATGAESIEALRTPSGAYPI